MKIIILLSMLFLHIFADYHVQGCLANMKQKKWWQEQTDDEKYKHDYIMALIEHSYEWAFIINIPIIIYYFYYKSTALLWIIVGNIIINTFFHAVFDNEKANLLKSNLIQDQIWHLIQIMYTWLVFYTM